MCVEYSSGVQSSPVESSFVLIVADSPVESSPVQFCVKYSSGVQSSPVESSFVLSMAVESSPVQWSPVLC